MKTAMQELIEQMTDLTWRLMTFEQKIEVFNIFLEKEKEHIRSAYNKGRFNAIDGLEISSAEYFDQTYKQNK